MPKRVQKTQAEPETLDIDISEAQHAFERLEAALRALGEDELQTFRVDIQRAAAIAHSVAVRDNQPDRRARFERLASAGFYDIELLDQLRTRALATWYARAQQVHVAALSSDARLAESVVRDATEVRARMLRVLEHYYTDDAQVAPTLAVIRRGTGYQDLANDLLALSELYEREDVEALIKRDPVHYRASDVAAAYGNAQMIFRALGLGEVGEARRWASLATRAWTLLARAYESTRAAAGVLFAGEEDVAATYPSLVTATRAAAPRKRPSGGEAPVPETQPG